MRTVSSIFSNRRGARRTTSAVSNLEMGCTDLQVLEIQETPEWGTRLVSNPERNHLHLMQHWGRTLLLRGSFHFLQGKKPNSETETNKQEVKASWANTHQHSGTRRRRLGWLLCSTGSWRVTCRSWDLAPCQRTYRWLQTGCKEAVNIAPTQQWLNKWSAVFQPTSLHLRPATLMPGMLVGISMPYLHFSASNSRSKHPVPAGASWPSMMFSDTPFMGSLSPWDDASINTSTWRSKNTVIKIKRDKVAASNESHDFFKRRLTVSSKEHFMSGPVSWRLMPWRVMAIRWPRHVMVSQSRAKWR